MATLQIRIDDMLKKQADALFSSSLEEAVYDSKFQRNIHGPFENAEDAVVSMLED